jgi:regulation of enolase protein 1 (concanavalin A-like superfamily)
MIKLRDHYFIAWLKIVKKYDVIMDKSGIYVDINNNEFNKAQEEYRETMKPLLKEIRSFVKELAVFTSNSKKSND